jgi:hypothetical protein
MCDTTFMGGFRSRDYDPRIRDWYTATKSAQQTYWTAPYPFFSNLDMGITYSAPIYETITITNTTSDTNQTEEDKETVQIFRGVWAVDFELDWISAFLRDNYRESETSVLIVEANGPEHYIIATSTGTANSRLVFTNDTSLACDDRASQECTTVRVPVEQLGDKGNQPDDYVLLWAFQAQQKANFTSMNRVAFTQPGAEVGSPVYSCDLQTFRVREGTNLEWYIIAAIPLAEDTENVATVGTSAFAVIIAMASFGFFTCLTMFFVFRRFRNHEAIILVDWRFTCGFLLLCSVLNLSSLTLLGENTDGTCMLRMWSFNLLFATALSPLFVKVYRMAMLIEASTSFRRKTVTHTQAIMYSIPICALEVLILLVFSWVDPPRAVKEFVSGPDEDLVRITCSTDTSAFFITQLCYNSLLILVGCYLAYRTRNLDSRFSEASSLALACYNIAFAGTLFLVITKVVNMEPIHEKIIQTVGVLWGTVFSSLVFPLPRLLKIGEPSQPAAPMRLSIRGREASRSTSRQESDSRQRPRSNDM